MMRDATPAVALIERVEAGSELRGLTFQCRYCKLCGVGKLRAIKLVALQEGEGSASSMAVIEGVEAGSVLKGLTFQCLDEAGRPAEAGTPFKLQVSWSRGAKKQELKDHPMPLPSLQASTLCASPSHHPLSPAGVLKPI